MVLRSDKSLFNMPWSSALLLRNLCQQLEFQILDLLMVAHGSGTTFLSNKEAFDKYWQILEHFYATADPRIALLAFLGSTVNEVFRRSSWALVRATTPDQRAAILKHFAKNSLGEKNHYDICKKISQDLSLTLEQVLLIMICLKKLTYSFGRSSLFLAPALILVWGRVTEEKVKG